MKLNNSTSSIRTGGSFRSLKLISSQRIESKEPSEKILFDLTDFQSLDSQPQSPYTSALKDSNSQPQFFHTRSNASETRLPPIHNKYHVANQLDHQTLMKKKTIKEKENKNDISLKQIPKPPDLNRLSSELIVHPTSEDFHAYNKYSERINDMQQMNNSSPNIYSKLNMVMSHERCMPRKLQLLNQITDKEIVAQGQLSSKGYVRMFAAGLGSSSYTGLQKINLSQNHLTNDDLKLVCQEMPKTVTNLQLQSNRLSKQGAKSISQLITSSNLLELNLERNFLKDGGLKILLDSLQNNKILKILNLSYNQIQDTQMENFEKIIRKNNTLQELYLHYNQITYRGGVHIFKGLMKNNVLKVLDLSFNRLGSNIQCTQAICTLIARPHPELIHIDLSHNHFNDEDSKHISQNLAFNKILYGFHFDGNSTYSINSRGFLMPEQQIEKVHITEQDEINVEEDQNRQLELQIENFEVVDKKNIFKRINGVDIVPQQISENCWICQGWVEHVFQWKFDKSGTLNQEPIFLHLEFENYRPSLMEESPDGFILYRMCPPNQTIRYFYSNPVMNVQIYAKDQKTTQTLHHSQLRNFGVPLQYANGTIINSKPMHVVNMIQTSEAKPIVDRHRHYLPRVFCKPREPERIVEIDPELAKKRIWSLDTSIFKDYEADTDAHLEQCLDFDLDASKVAKHISGMNELNRLKETIKKYYPFIISCYKYNAALSYEDDFPRITMTTIQGFFQQSKALQQIKQVDWEISLISTLVMRDPKFQFFKERCLVRHQFIELIIRLAKECFMRNGSCKTFYQAFDKIMGPGGHLSFIQDYGSAQQWREERYWIQIMDLTIRFKMPILKQLFNLVSSYSSKSFTKEKFIMIQDFKTLFSHAELFPDMLSEQDIYFSFLQSIMMQVDELNSARHFQMEFIEFIEALARIAEKLSPNSPKYRINNLNGRQRRTLPLYIKFEGLLYILYYRLRKFDVDPNIIDKSVLQSHEAKKLGIFIDEEENQISDEDQDIYMDPYYIIQGLLFDDEGRQSFKDNMSSGSKSRKTSLYRQESMTSGWSKVRQIARRPTFQNQLQLLKLAEIENEMEEKAEFEESTPLNKLKIENRKHVRSKFDTIKFDGPQYKYDLHE